MAERIRRRRRTRGEWQQLIEEQARSGMDVRSFCREHDLGLSTFYMSRQRLRAGAPAPQPGFVELKQQALVPRSNTAPLVVRCGPVSIELHAPVDEAMLRSVVMVAAETVAQRGWSGPDAAAG